MTEHASPFDDSADKTVNPGMTLRDYFAAKAIQGLLAHPDCGWVGDTNEGSKQRTMLVAKEAFAVADAMLKAREQK